MIVSRAFGSTTTTNAGLTTSDVVGFVLGTLGFIALLFLSIRCWYRRPKLGRKTNKQDEESRRQQYDYQSAGLGITLTSQPYISKGAVIASPYEIPHISRSQLYRPQACSPKVLQSPPAVVLSAARNIQHSMTISIEPPTPPTKTRGRALPGVQTPSVAMSPIPEARVVLLSRLENMARTQPNDAFVSEVPSDASSQYSGYLPQGRGLSGPSEATDASEFDIDQPNKKYREDRMALFERGDRTRSEIALISSLGSDGTDRSLGGQKKHGYLNGSRPLGHGHRLTVPRPLNVIKKTGDGNTVDMRGLGVGHLESELDELSRANSTRR